MVFFLAAGVLTLLVAAVLVRPLLRDLTPPPAASRFNAAVYRDQLDELQRDAEREGLGAGDVAGARLEIERRLIATARTADPGPTQARRAPLAAAVVLTGVFTLAAMGVYLAVGDPLARDHPFAPPTAAPAMPSAADDPMHGQVDQLVAALQQRLRTHPQDAFGWGLLARTQMRLGRPAEAVLAYAKAVAASPKDNPDLDGGYAEAQVMAAGGQVDARALKLFERLRAAEPTNPQARYYLALAKAQAGDVKGAVADWRSLEAASPAGAPWLPTVRARIAEALGKPIAQTPR